MQSDPKDTVQEIVEEASMAAGQRAQFLPIVIIIEVVAALVSIWHDCHDKQRAAKMVMRADQRPWTGSGATVRSAVYRALPESYRSPELVDHIIRIAADKLRKTEIEPD